MHKIYYSQLGKFGYVEYEEWCDLIEGLIHSITVRFSDNLILNLTLSDLQ
jgi:hypothetical protein